MVEYHFILSKKTDCKRLTILFERDAFGFDFRHAVIADHLAFPNSDERRRGLSFLGRGPGRRVLHSQHRPFDIALNYYSIELNVSDRHSRFRAFGRSISGIWRRRLAIRCEQVSLNHQRGSRANRVKHGPQYQKQQNRKKFFQKHLFTPLPLAPHSSRPDYCPTTVLFLFGNSIYSDVSGWTQNESVSWRFKPIVETFLCILTRFQADIPLQRKFYRIRDAKIEPLRKA